jgi:hypothetical protein
MISGPGKRVRRFVGPVDITGFMVGCTYQNIRENGLHGPDTDISCHEV